MRYAKGVLEVKCLGKERGWNIVVKSTGQIAKGTKEYDTEEAAYMVLKLLENGGDDD